MTFFYALFLLMMSETQLIYDFESNNNASDWQVVDDGVMGGRSTGSFELSKEGHGVFKGFVSLKNNGGFSSVRYRFAAKEATAFEKFVIRLKGDGKQYRFRVKTSSQDYYSYTFEIATSGEWQTVAIPFHSMYPSFRGRRLDLPNYPGTQVAEVAFLIGNKREESFRLEIDRILMD